MPAGRGLAEQKKAKKITSLLPTHKKKLTKSAAASLLKEGWVSSTAEGIPFPAVDTSQDLRAYLPVSGKDGGAEVFADPKTREVYVAYRKAGYSKKFKDEHESDILLHQAAKKIFDE